MRHWRRKPTYYTDPRREAWLQWHDRMFATPRLENRKGWIKLFRRYSK